MNLLRHSTPTRLIALLAVVIIGGGGGTATACKLWLNCHLRAGPSFEHEIQRYEGQSSDIGLNRTDLGAVAVARGFTYPTDFVFLPGGGFLVAERDGRIRSVAANGVVNRRLVLDLRRKVDTRYFRGVLGLAIDPDFGRHPYIYVAYTPPPSGRTFSTVVRVSRFTLAHGRAKPATEKVIVGADDAGPCEEQPVFADCVPSSLDVDGGDIEFAPDQTMFLSTGFGGGYERVEPSAFLAQNVNTLGGKILHVDRNGNGLPGNPYWNGDPKANRSKVWAYGFRNPFRMGLVSTSPTMLVAGNVGWYRWESLLRITKGGNYGWPCYEARARTPHYESTRFCRSYYRSHPNPPGGVWLAVPHPKAYTMIGGTSLAGATALPRDLRRDFLFADWETGKISVVPTAQVARPRPTVIARNAGGPDRFRIGPDGAVYYLAANSGQLRRIAGS